MVGDVGGCYLEAAVPVTPGCELAELPFQAAYHRRFVASLGDHGGQNIYF